MRTRTARFKYRAYPTEEQREWLAQSFGCARVVYNNYIYQREQKLKHGTPIRTSLTVIRSLPEEYSFLKHAGSKILQQAERQAQTAYKNYFESKAGKRKGAPVRKPKYKKKKNGGSIVFNGTVKIVKLNRKWSAVRLPKDGGLLKFRLSRDLPLSLKSCTVILTPSGHYYVSFTGQQEIAEPKEYGSQPVSGGDMGIADLITVVQSDGKRYKIGNPKHLKHAERKLRRAHKDFSRCQKGSKNQERARLRLAKAYRDLSAKRLDLHRKIAFKLAGENQAVSLETLNVKGMVKNKRLAKAISDASWCQLKSCIEQACEKLGTEFFAIDRWAPTSQVCSVCGVQDAPKGLRIREWECPACGAFLDRDFNAALNILLAAGHAESLNADGGDIRLRLAGAVLDEAVTPAQTGLRPA